MMGIFTVRKVILPILICALSACSALRPYEGDVPRSGDDAGWAEFRRGNIIPNFSFEEEQNGVPRSWSGLGCALSSEAKHGERALVMESNADAKLTKCVSEAFDVVPGNYELTTWIKTSELNLSEDRHFTDVISIRLRLFDNSGSEISPYVTFLGKTIDGLELNYALSHIESDAVLPPLGYTLMHLVPRFHPYDAGWLPAETRSAKIEFTLRGPGKVWFDDPTMRFSKWNFPLAERVRYLAASADDLSISPAPQYIQTAAEPIILSPKHSNLCFLRPARRVHNAINTALLRLEEKLHGLGFPSPIMRGSCSDADHIIAVNPDGFAKKFKSEIKGSEGYVIFPFITDDGREATAILSNTHMGSVYALDTLQQLFTAEPSGNIQLRRVLISDWPATRMRAISSKDPRRRALRQEVYAADWLPESRLNTLFLEIDTPDLRWWSPTQTMIDAARRLGAERRASETFNFGVLINPYIHRRDKTLNRKIEFSDPALKSDFVNAARIFLENGAKYVIFRADDFPPTALGEKFGYILDSHKDREKFGTLANAHAQFYRDVSRQIRNDFPKASVLFVSPWYNNIFTDLSLGKGEEYLSEISKILAKETPMMWTGPTVRSLFIDEAHIRRYSLLTQTSAPLLWDNTIYARRGPDYWGKSPARLPLNSYFEPYDVAMPVGVFERELLHPDVFINGQVSELYRIQIATVGAFLWNPDSYNPEKALWSYLKRRFGEEGAILLLRADETIWRLRAEKTTCTLGARSGSRQIQIVRSLGDKGIALVEMLRQRLGTHATELLDELRDQLMRDLADINAPGFCRAAK